MSGARRELTVAVVLCLAGALLALVAVGRTWASVRLDPSGLLPARTVGVSGRELAGGLSALAIVGLAGVVALAATRRRGRIAVGALLLLDGVGVVVVVVDRLRSVPALALASDAVSPAGSGSVGTTPWPYVCLLGGLLLAVAGLLVAVRGARWAALGRTYEPPATGADPVPGRQAAPLSAADTPTAAPTERGLWEALDRGEDPTAP